ncbi:MAG TPA: PQQ-dependent sugar dehydrogenase [Polyangiaceae bacterium]|nr:PQQ-dependent sugar dehydrogenase [Polyangiaceae bacterium]
MKTRHLCLIFALLVSGAACGSSDPQHLNEAPASGGEPSTAAASGGAGGEHLESPDAALEVDFEELELDGEPMFITDFAFYPGSDSDFLALDKSGKLLRYRLEEQRAQLLSTTELAGVYDDLDCGAMSLAFDPDLTAHPYVYVGACVSLRDNQILRLDLDGALDVVAESEVTILEVEAPRAKRPWHNVGSLGFEDGGVMWALFGDKALGKPAQDLSENVGKLLRIVPSRKPGLGGYEPAPDNPLLGDDEASPDVYALGLRSPFRGTRDSHGFYWVADVGSDSFEEINIVRQPLANFGWPDREGPCDECDDTTSPAFYWEHGTDADYVADDPDVETTIGRVAWAGPEVLAHDPDRYGGRLAGSVLFGDYCAGFVRHGRVDEDGAPTLDAPLGHLNNASAFRQHTDGFVYALTFGRCQTDADNQADEGQSRLYRMVPKN